MKKNTKRNLFEMTPLLALVLVIGFTGTINGAEAKQLAGGKPEAPKVDDQTEQAQAVQSEVEAKAGDKVADKRKEIIKEAMDAVAETRKALKALEDGQSDEALAALEVATGKLALIVAREPDLALAPLDVGIITHDLYARVGTVKARVALAEDLLEDGLVQDARAMLRGLASEVRIRTTHVPLATYPDAIKAIVPLIDEGNVEDAKRGLQLALNTLVVTEEIIPLPILRAQELLRKAEELAENEERTIKQNDDLAGMLDDARTQVELAEALGYGKKQQYKPILDQIREIEEKTHGSSSGKGFFDKIKEKLAEF